MQGMGILFQTREPFWTLKPPAGVERNPLNYFLRPEPGHAGLRCIRQHQGLHRLRISLLFRCRRA